MMLADATVASTPSPASHVMPSDATVQASTNLNEQVLKMHCRDQSKVEHIKRVKINSALACLVHSKARSPFLSLYLLYVLLFS
jgi:hypothetical protein